MSDALTMRDTAAALGLSYERFRKVWPQLVRERGFPAPFLGRRWSAEAVRAWIARRSSTPPAAEPKRGAAPTDRARDAWDQLDQARAAG